MYNIRMSRYHLPHFIVRYLDEAFFGQKMRHWRCQTNIVFGKPIQKSFKGIHTISVEKLFFTYQKKTVQPRTECTQKDPYLLKDGQNKKRMKTENYLHYI